ncbi:MAG: GNAT family N-acetyltransferase [Deltaproteobacteria bacterium]|nr:GNAT family N-acetyltransferase [Deltaproteobacteria bacterium]
MRGNLALSFRIARSASELEALTELWKELLLRSEANEPTLTPEWMTAWWRVHGGTGGRTLRVVLFFREGRLVGLVPLLWRIKWYRPGVPFRRLELLASGEREADETCSDYIGIIAERGFEEEIAVSLADLLMRGDAGAWDELVLTGMNGEHGSAEMLARELDARGASAEIVPRGVAPYIPLPRTWSNYLAALTGSHRYYVNRSLRDFEAWAKGKARLVQATTQGELELGERILRGLHSQRWEGCGKPGMFVSPRFRAFHATVLPELLRQQALDLSWISVEQRPIAVLYNMRWNGKVYFYQAGRSLVLPKDVRPGIVLHCHAIKRAIERGDREYDFLAGASRYKMQLANATRPLVALRAVRTPALEAVRKAAEQGGQVIRGWAGAARARIL